MRSHHWQEPLATQATAHSLHTQAWAATRPLAKQCQLAVGLHLRNPSLMDYYSFNRPRRDGRLSWPCWLTDSGHFTHKVVTRPAVSLAQGQGKHAGRTGGLNHYATPPTIIYSCGLVAKAMNGMNLYMLTHVCLPRAITLVTSNTEWPWFIM